MSPSLPRVAEIRRILFGSRERGESNVPFRWDIVWEVDSFVIHSRAIELSLLLPRDQLCRAGAIMNGFWTTVTWIYCINFDMYNFRSLSTQFTKLYIYIYICFFCIVSYTGNINFTLSLSIKMIEKM